MSRAALYFASGESLYLGAVLLLLAVIATAYPKRKWMLQLRNLLAWVALACMVMACPPFPLAVDLIFFVAFAFWFGTSNQSSPSQRMIRWQIGSRLFLAVLVCVLAAIEFPHRKMPSITDGVSDHFVVIGDSISSGLDPHIEPWPLVLQQTCGIEVRNLAKPGTQVREALSIAKELRDSDRLVLIEIGGNDLLMGVSADEYGKVLDELLANVATHNRTVIMFELPLLPNKIAYGQIQRRLSQKYGVSLIPKRYFAQVIGDAEATTDGLHLSGPGARRMAGLVAEVLSLVFKSCRSSRVEVRERWECDLSRRPTNYLRTKSINSPLRNPPCRDINTSPRASVWLAGQFLQLS